MSDDSRSQPKRPLLFRLKALLNSAPSDRDELQQTLRDAADETIIDRDTLSMLEGVMSVAELRVRDIMIPRTQMVVIHEDDELKDILPVIVQSGHSRYPVIGKNRDQVEGVLLAKDLLQFNLLTPDEANKAFDIDEILRPSMVVPESKKLDSLLREFRISRNHMAIVVDEYGGVAGLITIEDVLEQIVGDIADEFDFEEDEYQVRQLGANEWHVSAAAELDEFNRQFGTQFDEEEYDTIGGTIAHAFGHMPSKGEQVVVGDLNFTVIACDSRRIKLLRVQRKPSLVNRAKELA